MEQVIKMALANSVLLHSTIEALLTKGVLSKGDIQNALTTINYESPIPADILSDVRKMVAGLSGDS